MTWQCTKVVNETWHFKSVLNKMPDRGLKTQKNDIAWKPNSWLDVIMQCSQNSRHFDQDKNFAASLFIFIQLSYFILIWIFVPQREVFTQFKNSMCNNHQIKPVFYQIKLAF